MGGGSDLSVCAFMITLGVFSMIVLWKYVHNHRRLTNS